MSTCTLNSYNNIKLKNKYIFIQDKNYNLLQMNHITILGFIRFLESDQVEIAL